MKKNSLCLLTLVGAALLAVTGCNTVKTSHRQDVGTPGFAPSNPDQVQILRTEPTRAHVRLGEVQAEPSSESVDVSVIEAALRKEAAKLGADAAVVVCDKTQVTGSDGDRPMVGKIGGSDSRARRHRCGDQISIGLSKEPIRRTVLN